MITESERKMVAVRRSDDASCRHDDCSGPRAFRAQALKQRSDFMRKWAYLWHRSCLGNEEHARNAHGT